MTLAHAKLAFVHRRLWQRDLTYRYAVLLGPPPLIGAIVAAGLWFAPSYLKAPSELKPTAPWAKVSPQVINDASDPKILTPGMSLPAPGPAGFPIGYATGWQGGIHPVELNATMNANVLRTRLAPLTLDETQLDLGPIIAAGPPASRFAAVATASFAVYTPGTYSFALRVERDDADLASCLQRLAFGGQTVLNTLNLDYSGPRVLTFASAAFTVQPGLYPIIAVFGCWSDEREGGVGKATLLVQRPGEDLLRPARPNEILRAVPAKQ